MTSKGRVSWGSTCTVGAWTTAKQSECSSVPPEHTYTPQGKGITEVLKNITNPAAKPVEHICWCRAIYSTDYVCAPEAACRRAASSAGIGRVVTFTTSLLMRSCTHPTYRCNYILLLFFFFKKIKFQIAFLLTSSAFLAGATTV